MIIEAILNTKQNYKLKFVETASNFLTEKLEDSEKVDIPSSSSSLQQLLALLVLFVIVIVACYFVTRWIAKTTKGMNAGKNIKVIETLMITNNKYIQIIKVANEYIAVAVTKDNITFLTKVDESGIDFNKADATVYKNFTEIFKRAKLNEMQVKEENCEDEKGDN